MTKIKFFRIGTKKKPFYRIIVADSRKKQTGAYIENLGTYNPLNKETKINEESVLKWLMTGAKPNTSVRKLLSSQKIMEKFHNMKLELKKNNPKKKKSRKSPSKTAVTKSPTKTVSKSTTKTPVETTTKSVDKPAAKPCC